jgi:hypothetical protein
MSDADRVVARDEWLAFARAAALWRRFSALRAEEANV